MAKKPGYNSILTVAILAGAGYYAFNKFIKPMLDKSDTPKDKFNDTSDKIKQEQVDQETAQKKANEKRVAFYEIESIANPNSYMGKVAKIQTNLGVFVDGKAGQITNAEFQKRYGLDRGVISRANIDYYVQKVERDKYLFM